MNEYPVEYASPVRAPLRVVSAGPAKVRATVTVDADEPAFAGHYPGFAIFPGACVLEYLHRATLAGDFGDEQWELLKMKTVRFVGPVFAGDVLTIDVDVRRQGAQWIAAATARSVRGPVASADLRYTEGGHA